MKKKILGILFVICVIFSSGPAAAATVARADLPKHLQSAVPSEYGLWFPAVPSLPGSPFYLESYIIIANFYNDNTTVSVMATAYSDATDNQLTTTEQYSLGPFEKLVLTLNDFDFSDTIADIWITSEDAPIFGATVLLMDSITYEVMTTIPHIDIQIEP